ncbi:hypothetical protein [Pseudomonas syringae]|uniref:hypothetical protein n=1 Tax=Pseudomonas syringae TaxID=317 RepID=UPI001113C812|nr:hypothetical protein [Pseudomonas syringae]
MAMSNSTATHHFQCVGSIALPRFPVPHLEKISCSFSSTGDIEPSDLLGMLVLVDEYQPSVGLHSAEVFTYFCHVTGLLLGAHSLGRSSQLALRVDGSDTDQLVPISRLTVKSVQTPNIVS